MSVSIKQLKAFVAVVEEKSFSLAAERLNATQSGMSMLVQNLEISIGKQLINRSPGKMVLTDSGLTFYDYSIDILKLMEKALIEVKSNTKELTGSFNCGLMPTFTRSALPNTLTEFLTDNPKVDIKITEAYSGVLEEMVRSNKLEFAIVPSVKNPIGLNVEFISSDINLLVTSKNSLFKHLEPINLSSVKNIKIILPGPENSRRVAINEYFATHNINVIKKLEMDGMIGTLQMIATSDWSAILPAALCHLDLSGETRTLSPLISPNLITDYVMITSASKELSPVAELFSKKICKEIKNLSKNFNEKAKLIN
ncbi:MAG: LysR family transcriptional regulator [Candidatus Puniceispirillales bacterium]|jgi:LysR family nitrogen assimilation transcriptional regulator|tara:strand:- start:33 stop:965 length:933 start_codon:yes stop_codon:yes gene_type:complete